MLSSRLPLVWTAISVVALIALVALVFLGATLMSGLSGMATYLIMLTASALLAVAVAAPSVIMSKSRLGDKRPV